MALTQVQIIQSLGEALSWFQKELEWKVEAAELRHLTGRIGELYAAMITRGQMALGVNERGYDVVSAEGQRISVKTVTSSTHVSFKKSTLHNAQQAMILRINTADGEAAIEELFAGAITELISKCNDTPEAYQYFINKPQTAPIPLDGLAITGRAQIGDQTVIQYENSSIAVETNGARDPVAKPLLLQIASKIGVSPLNGAGNPMNTRQLGAAIIAAAGGSPGMMTS